MQIGEPLVILGPEHAKTIAGEGLTKKDIKEFLFQRSKLPKGVFSKEHQEYRFANFSADALIPVAQRPEDIIIIVAGGSGKHSMVTFTFGNTLSVTKLIEA